MIDNYINGHVTLLVYNLYYGCHMAYSCNCTCIYRHRLVISMKIVIVRTYLHIIYQKYE